MFNPIDLNYQSIGIYKGKAVNRYDVPRQSSLQEHQGVIRLNDGYNFQQALEDLVGMERIWLIYHFHLNEAHWKTKVNTPRTLDGKKKGVFATRAPYRPNPIGMSCVKLDKIKGLKVYVSESDLLDGSPILDIKPYIPYADSFSPKTMGWLDNIESTAYQLAFSELAKFQIAWLEKNTDADFTSFLERNLEYQPTNSRHKRVSKEDAHNAYHIALKTWRIFFKVSEEFKSVTITKILPGYSHEKLHIELDDPFLDKAIHKKFIELFKSSDSDLLSYAK